MSSVLLNKTDANQTVELAAPGLKVSMKRASANATEGVTFIFFKTLKLNKPHD